MTDSRLADLIRDPDRLAAVAATRLAGTGPEDAFDRLTELAVAVSGAPLAFVTLVDDERSWFKSVIGLREGAERSAPVTETFCKYVVGSGQPLVVEDALHDERVQGNRAIERLGVRAWAGFPIVSTDHLTLGAMCLVDVEPRQWSDLELHLLSTLAQAAGAEIALRRAEAELRLLRPQVLPQQHAAQL